MAKADFDEVERFVQRYVGSVGQLEILLLLHSLRSEHRTARQINDTLRSSLSSVENRLANLQVHRLVKSEGDGENRVYRFAPEDPELTASVDKLAVIYEKFRGRVVDLIFSPRDQMRSFSDAFRIKDEEDKPDA